MAVQLVIFDGVDAVSVELGIVYIIRHAIAHLLSDVGNNGFVRGFDQLELGDHHVEMYKQLPVLLRRSIPIECPPILLDNIMEVSQQRLLGLERYCHVILNRVKASEDQVE